MISISEDAALTILLHASKFPSTVVFGALLGKSGVITEVIPLLHRSHVMAPCVEMAIAQVNDDEICAVGDLLALVSVLCVAYGAAQCRCCARMHTTRCGAALCVHPAVFARPRRKRKVNSSFQQQVSLKSPLALGSKTPPTNTKRKHRKKADVVADARGLSLLGIYWADYQLAPADLGPLARRIADRIAERRPGAAALVLDNAKLADFCSSIGGGGSDDGGDGGEAAAAVGPFDLWLRDNQSAGVKGGAWRKVQQKQKQQQPAEGDGGEIAATAAAAGGGGLAVAGAGGWASVQKRYLNLFAAGRHRSLVDYEEHLDDVGLDFLNEGLLAGSELLSR
jgi:hypothetical protein